MTTPALGTIGWIDLTIPEADKIRDFYSAVAGWTSQGIDMKDGDTAYQDYCMMPPGAEAPAAGICHRRGANAPIPAAWIIYIMVADLEGALEKAAALGGSVLKAPAGAGSGRFAIIQDPAGAVCGLYQSA